MAEPSLRRADYYYFLPITTRWMDNDLYGHVNNVVYYSYFDTVANHFLITRGGLDIHNGDVIGYVVNSQCSYESAIAYPERIEGGFRVNRLGSSSVEYGVAIFKEGDDTACAVGTFTHVFVDRHSQRPTPIPPTMRQALESVSIGG